MISFEEFGRTGEIVYICTQKRLQPLIANPKYIIIL